MPYIIKQNTLALIPEGKGTKIMELSKEIMENNSPHNIVKYNCYINGSSFDGRRNASIYLIGANYKPPIVICETNKLILIPTHSHRNNKCIWLVLNNILKYSITTDQQVTIIFKNNQKIKLNVSYATFDKQILRATRLESVIRSSKSKKYL